LPMVAHLELLSRARYRADLLTLGMFPGENQLWAFLAVCVPPRVESLVAFYARKRAGLAREMERGTPVTVRENRSRALRAVECCVSATGSPRS
jgi:hypothetical protein